MRSTGGRYMVPVGEGTLGRIFNVLGKTIDSDAPVKAAALWPIHRPAPELKYQADRAHFRDGHQSREPDGAVYARR